MATNSTAYVVSIANGIPLLTGADGNWFTWNTRSYDFFLCSGLKGIHDKLPNKPTDADELVAWNKNNEFLKPLFASRVSDEYRYLVDELPTVKECYDALKKHFQRSTMGSRMNARQDLYRITHDPSLHISSYFHAADTARSKLAALGVTVDEQEFKDIILMNLDPSLHLIRTTLLSSKTEPDLATVRETLSGASSASEPIVKIEGAHMARSARGGPSSRHAGSAADGITDAKGNVWCNPYSSGCHRCGRGNHQAYRCISDMPTDVKNKIIPSSAMETAAFAAKHDDFDLEAFNAAFAQVKPPPWARNPVF